MGLKAKEGKSEGAGTDEVDGTDAQGGTKGDGDDTGSDCSSGSGSQVSTGNGEVDSSLEDSHPVSADPYPYQTIFQIVSLLPSARLIIYVPSSANVDLSALILALCTQLDPIGDKSWHLTIFISTGNKLTLSSDGVPERLIPMPWATLDMIFIPDSSGVFPSLPDIGKPPFTAMTMQPTHPHYAGLCDGAIRNLFAAPTWLMPSWSNFTIAGYEGTEVSKETRQNLQKAMTEIICDSAVPPGREIDFVAFAEWRKSQDGSRIIDWLEL